MSEIREIRPREQRKSSPTECYWCGASPKPPSQLIPVSRHHWTQTIVLALRTSCCHAAVSTEHFGSVLDYLCDGWKRAERLCAAYNREAGAPVEEVTDRPPQFVAVDPNAEHNQRAKVHG